MPKTSKPLVSICVPCFNHEKYIPYFMESIINQTYENWELIVTDDCSTDNSYQLLKSYRDNRIKIFKNDKNRHLCETLNNSFSKAKGDYICIMYTDDAMINTKLELDINHFLQKSSIDVLYTDLMRIDESNTPISFPLWTLPSSNKDEILNQLFYNGNLLSIPGLVFKKECLEKVGGHNPFLCLTQDYEFHIRLLSYYQPAMSERPTVYYRVRENEMNLSNMNYLNMNLMYSEIPLALRAFVENIKTVKQLLDIFPEAIKYGEPTENLIPYFIGRLAIDADAKHVKYFGFNLLYNFLNNEKLKQVENLYGFLGKDFMSLLKFNPIFYVQDSCKGKDNKNILVKKPFDLNKITFRKVIKFCTPYGLVKLFHVLNKSTKS